MLVSLVFPMSFVSFADVYCEFCYFCVEFCWFCFLRLELLVLCLFTVSFVSIMLITRPLYWFETVRTPLNSVGPLIGFVRFVFVSC